MKNIIDTYKESIKINLNLLDIIDSNDDESNYNFNKDISNALNFDYDLMNVYYDSESKATIAFIKKNKKGCDISELSGYCEYVEYTDYDENYNIIKEYKILKIDKNDLSIVNNNKDYKYSFNKTDIYNIKLNIDISKIKKYNEIIKKLKEEKFFDNEENKETICIIQNYEEELLKLYKEIEEIIKK